jgi:hypothetical protein
VSLSCKLDVETCGLQEEEFEGDNRIGMVPPSVGSQRIHIGNSGAVAVCGRNSFIPAATDAQCIGSGRS